MVLLGLLDELSRFFRPQFVYDKAIIDSLIFRVHYRITGPILFGFCVLVTANQLFGEPMHCQTDVDSVGLLINDYCWVMSTFTLPDTRGTNGEISNLGNPNSFAVRYHTYYQWIPFTLFVQGLLFYLPHWLWKLWENKRIEHLTDGIRGSIPIDKEEKKQQIGILKQYLSENLYMHNAYAICYFFCECLNFINIIVNIYFTNALLNGSFLDYGPKVLQYYTSPEDERSNPMSLVFPKRAKCTYYNYGHSGTRQTIDALCILLLNVVNEKIFFFLWFWFMALVILSTFSLVYIAGPILYPTSRVTILRTRFKFITNTLAENKIKKMKIGDYWILHLLAKNLNRQIFREVANYVIENNNPKVNNIHNLQQELRTMPIPMNHPDMHYSIVK